MLDNVSLEASNNFADENLPNDVKLNISNNNTNNKKQFSSSNSFNGVGEENLDQPVHEMFSSRTYVKVNK